MDAVHNPVMKEEVFRYLNPQGGEELLVDCTLGEGGHAEYFLMHADKVRIAGVEADADILAKARKRLEPWGQRVSFYNAWFDAFFSAYPLTLKRPDMILFDLGISVFHYEQSGRGFSFAKNEPLDMRINKELRLTAADIVNTYKEEELADIFFRYGEERYSRRIAWKIVQKRKSEAIESADSLARIVYEAVPPAYKHGRIHPATRCFQALRIVVNSELERLESALSDAFRILSVRGRMGVIAFHSLEDRIVKGFFREKNKACICPPETPMCNCGGKECAHILTKKPVRPQESELEENAPSRSARFRAVIKLREETA